MGRFRHPGGRFISAHIHVYYRYSRIETLSGLSNGIFLILISVFIVFEAVQRMYVTSFPLASSTWILLVRSLSPPEMNTSQLLLVSSIGLAVNLFGMFAMGGHHHHVRSSVSVSGVHLIQSHKGS